jgi:hypothetical protein
MKANHYSGMDKLDFTPEELSLAEAFAKREVLN